MRGEEDIAGKEETPEKTRPEKKRETEAGDLLSPLYLFQR